MSNLKKTYTKKEQEEIVKLNLEDGQSIKDLSVRFEVSSSVLYSWRSSYIKSNGNTIGKKKEKEALRKLKALEQELKTVKLERDILKKAVAIFSRTDGKFSNL